MLFRLQPILLVISIGVAWLFPLVALGARFDLWSYKIAFSLLAGCALTAAIVLALAGFGLVSAIKQKNQKAQHRSTLVVLILIVPLATLFYHGFKASQVPAIHDITTDTIKPPQFEKVVSIRPEGTNSLEIDQDVIALQKQHYPDLASIQLMDSKQKIMEKTQSLFAELGWETLSVNEEKGLLEAADTSFWFGFVDDVVVRVQELEPGKCLVDVRSASRVGKSDLGKNAQRIKIFLQMLTQEP